MTPRELWRDTYRAARGGGFVSRADWPAVHALALEWAGHTPRARFRAARVTTAAQYALERFPDGRTTLASAVLNGWGSKNPWGPRRGRRSDTPPGSHGARIASRARALRERLERRGVLECDAGGWVREVRGAPGYGWHYT